MSIEDTDKDGTGGDDVLVAEYVLGVLDAAEHQRVGALIAANPNLQQEMQFWQSRLASLDEAFEPAAPPAGTFREIEARLFGSGATVTPSLWQSLVLWRGLAGAGLAAAVVAIGLSVLSPNVFVPAQNATQLVATLEAENSTVKFVALYDGSTGTVRLTGLSGETVPDKDYELWFIQGDAAPVSLGLVPVNARTEVPLTGDMRAIIGAGTVFAVTLEPAGGAPGGVATGPVVAAGAVSLI
jgi:anti-sigma-K factor RskA